MKFFHLVLPFFKKKKNKGTEIPRNLDVVIDVEVRGHKDLSAMPGATTDVETGGQDEIYDVLLLHSLTSYLSCFAANML